MPVLRNRRWWLLPWLLLAMGSLAGVIWLEVVGCGPFFPLERAGIADLGLLLNGLAFAVIGPVLIFRRDDHPIGWLTTLIGGFVLISLFLNFYTECGVEAGRKLPALPLAAWFGINIIPYYFVLQFTLLPLIFPTGRFLTNRWRKLAWSGLGLLVIISIVHGLLPGQAGLQASGVSYPFQNPVGVDFLPAQVLLPIVTRLKLVLLLGLSLGAVISMVLRWYRASGDERQQLKWIAYYLGAIVVPSMLLGFFFNQLSASGGPPVWLDLLSAVSYVGFPVTIGIAIFKYRLYDVDLVIRRTLTYALLTGILALVYFGSVIISQSALRALSGSPGSQLATVLSTLAMAALFKPVRTRVQNFIDQRFYRRSYDARRVLQRFAARSRDEVDLERLSHRLMNTAARTLQPERVSLWLSDDRKGHGK